MTRHRALVLLAVSLVVANAAATCTLESNLVAGLYPVAADSISIPIFEGIIASLVIFGLVAGATHTPPHRRVLACLSVAFCVVAALIAALYALSWAVPNHFPIAVGFGVIAALCGFFAFGAVQQFSSDISVERDASPQSGSRPSL